MTKCQGIGQLQPTHFCFLSHKLIYVCLVVTHHDRHFAGCRSCNTQSWIATTHLQRMRKNLRLHTYKTQYKSVTQWSRLHQCFLAPLTDSLRAVGRGGLPMGDWLDPRCAVLGSSAHCPLPIAASVFDPQGHLTLHE